MENSNNSQKEKDELQKKLEAMEKVFELSISTEKNNLRFENYYSKISHLTIKSYLLDISELEMKSIVAYYRYKYNKKKDVFFDEHAQILRQLEKKIDNIMKTHFKNKDIFAKFSFRSPKEGKSRLIAHHKEYFFKFLNEYETLYQPSTWKLREGYDFNEHENKINFTRNAFLKAYYKVLRCSDSKDVMALITSANQVYVDFEFMLIKLKELRQQNIPYHWDHKLIIREWVEMDMCHEVRCFVNKNYLTCMTQNMSAIIEEYTNADFVILMRNIIFDFWKEKLQPSLDGFLDTYAFDVSWNFKDGKYDKNNLLNKENIEIHLVEINDFDLSSKFLLFKDQENGPDDTDLLRGVNLNHAEYSNKSVPFKVRLSLDVGFREELFTDYYDDDEEFLIPNNYEEVINEIDPPSNFGCSII